MKTFLLSLLSLFVGHVLIAQIYTVNNNTAQSADYSDLQVAINSVPNGSVLLIQGSSASYGDVHLTKPIVMIGPGYHLDNNPVPHTQANGLSAKIDELRIKPGGSGAFVSGMDFQERVRFDTTFNIVMQSSKLRLGAYIVNSGNISFERNFIQPTSTVSIYSYRSPNINVSQNIFYYSSTLYYRAIHITATSNAPSSATFEHNTVIRNSQNPYSIAYLSSNFASGIASLVSRNNIYVNVHPTPTSTSSFLSPYTSSSYCVVSLSHEVTSDSSLYGLSGVTINADPADMFQYWGNTGYAPDYILQTKTGSPAIGAGLNGADCGAFGGINQYLISGLSIAPNIYDIQMPTLGTTGYGIDVHIKARANH